MVEIILMNRSVRLLFVFSCNFMLSFRFTSEVKVNDCGRLRNSAGVADFLTK